MKIKFPFGAGTVPMDCPHMFVGVCESCLDTARSDSDFGIDSQPMQMAPNQP